MYSASMAMAMLNSASSTTTVRSRGPNRLPTKSDTDTTSGCMAWILLPNKAMTRMGMPDAIAYISRPMIPCEVEGGHA